MTINQNLFRQGLLATAASTLTALAAATAQAAPVQRNDGPHLYRVSVRATGAGAPAAEAAREARTGSEVPGGTDGRCTNGPTGSGRSADPPANERTVDETWPPDRAPDQPQDPMEHQLP